MSSYRTHYRPPVEGEQRWQVWMTWDYFTRRRLDWLYGPGRADTPQARADLESWNALGRKVAA